MSEQHSSRRARALNKDRTRQQALRDRKKAAKSPSTHTINRAIVHAIMVELKAQRSQGVRVGDVSLSFVNILDLSYKYLTKGTHAGNSYSQDEVRIAITARIQREAPKPGD